MPPAPQAPRRPSGGEEGEAACRGRCGGGSASPATRTPRGTARGLHPSSLLFDAGRRFVSLATWGVAVLFFAARSDQAWYLLFLLPPIVEALIRYVSFRYAFEAEHRTRSRADTV
jgi:hypothetical protein